MYAKFFGLKHQPFSIAPDPRYLFMSERHREALAHLLYGLKGGGGFVLLTGEIGAGKTTVCRCFLEQVPPRCNVAYIFNPKLTVPELLQTVCDEFRIPLPELPAGSVRSVKDYIDPLNEFLLRTHSVGQTNVLIIDEAQNLSADVLEQLRLLTNLETAERKLLQIILIGQPELREMLARPELEQLAQRVIARYHLGALSESESANYVQHRLGVAGGSGASPFDKAALKRIHQLSRGVPRRINLLCDRALLGGYATGQQRIGADVVEKAAAEVFGDAAAHRPAAWAVGMPGDWAASLRRAAPWAGGVLVGASIAAASAWMLRPPSGAARLPAAAASASSAPVLAAASATHAVAPPPSLASAPARAAAPAPAASSTALGASELRAVFSAQLRGESDAWRDLAAAWGLQLAGSADPCNAAAKQGVPCYKGPGSLALVRQLDRPGLLVLHDGDGRGYHVLLTALTADSATLRRGSASVTVPLATLGATWRGEFGTFWRAPEGYAGSGSFTAARGEAADGLAGRLAQLQPAGAASAPLASRIAAFQVTQGLPPDGLAGPLTLMLLNRATGVEEPRLLPAAVATARH
jgi:general secretion pathway protein A